MFSETKFSFRRLFGLGWGAKRNVTTMPIRVVAFPEGDRWCAQCLEYDIAVQSDDQDGLKAAIIDVIKSEIEVSCELGTVPFSGIPKAPEIFFKMYEDSGSRTTRERDRGVLNHKIISDSAMSPVIRWAAPVPAF